MLFFTGKNKLAFKRHLNDINQAQIAVRIETTNKIYQAQFSYYYLQNDIIISYYNYFKTILLAPIVATVHWNGCFDALNKLTSILDLNRILKQKSGLLLKKQYTKRTYSLT